MNATSAVSVASGAVFGGIGSAGAVSVSGSGAIQAGYNGTGTLNLSSLNFGGNGSINLASSSSATSLIAVSGTITASGTETININGPGLATGNYTLLTYAGTSGGGAFTLGTTGATVGQRPDIYTLFTSGGTALGLNVVLDSPLWNGSVNTSWDTNTTANWSLIHSGGTTTFLGGDVVLFNDTSTNYNVNINSGDVLPTSVTFSTTGTYTVSGSNGIGGSASLTKSGSGLLVLTNTNGYTGATTISGGTLQIGGGGYLGSGGTYGGNVANSSALVVSTSSNQVFSGPIFGNGAAYQLGSGVTTLSASNGFGGGVTLSAGGLRLGNSAALGTGPLTINGGSLDSAAANLAVSTANAQNWNGDFTFIGSNSLNLGAAR